MSYTLPLARLIEEFQKLPGIGPKSAQRLAFHVLKQSHEDVRNFSDALLDARDKIGYCQQCYNLSAQSVCEVCSQPGRKRNLLCIVSEQKDLYALERTGEVAGTPILTAVFQACTDTECLPPITAELDVAIDLID